MKSKTKVTRSELKKCAIIDAAMFEFQEKGFQQASMDNIAKNADVSKRTVYNHFVSKEVLFEAIACEMIKLLCLFENYKYEKEQPIKPQLIRLAEEEIKLLKTQEIISGSKVFIREALNNPILVTSIIDKLDQHIYPINTWFVDACADGIIKSNNPDIVSAQFVSVIKGFYFWPQIVYSSPFPDEEKQKMVINTVVEMIIKQYVD